MQAIVQKIHGCHGPPQAHLLGQLPVPVFARFGRDNGGLLAAGLAFFLVLAFVPLLLVGLWFLGHLYAGRPDEALHQIQTNILPQIVPGGGASEEVTHLMERAASPPPTASTRATP